MTAKTVELTTACAVVHTTACAVERNSSEGWNDVVKTWSDDNPQAGLMAQKRGQLVQAALRAFLEEGYGESSVNRIAEAAGVSIKTLYRHFDDKEDLFGAAMEAACLQSATEAISQADSLSPWLGEPPEKALVLAGTEYLGHALSEDQLALYRVVTRDAHRFPEVGRTYQNEVINRRNARFVEYLEHWAPSAGWNISEPLRASAIFAGLLQAPIYGDALYLGFRPTKDEIKMQAGKATELMLALLETGLL